MINSVLSDIGSKIDGLSFFTRVPNRKSLPLTRPVITCPGIRAGGRDRITLSVSILVKSPDLTELYNASEAIINKLMVDSSIAFEGANFETGTDGHYGALSFTSVKRLTPPLELSPSLVLESASVSFNENCQV